MWEIYTYVRDFLMFVKAKVFNAFCWVSHWAWMFTQIIQGVFTSAYFPLIPTYPDWFNFYIFTLGSQKYLHIKKWKIQFASSAIFMNLCKTPLEQLFLLLISDLDLLLPCGRETLLGMYFDKNIPCKGTSFGVSMSNIWQFIYFLSVFRNGK